MKPTERYCIDALFGKKDDGSFEWHLSSLEAFIWAQECDHTPGMLESLLRDVTGDFVKVVQERAIGLLGGNWGIFVNGSDGSGARVAALAILENVQENPRYRDIDPFQCVHWLPGQGCIVSYPRAETIENCEYRLISLGRQKEQKRSRWAVTVWDGARYQVRGHAIFDLEKAIEELTRKMNVDQEMDTE